MKKFTLLVVATLFAAISFAQKPVQALKPLEPMRTQQTQIQAQGVARNTNASTAARKALRRGGTVTPPEGATSETYYTQSGSFYISGSSGWVDYTSQMSTIEVIVDGGDIYIAGLAYWVRDSWIKGTISGTTASFPSGQQVDDDANYPEWILGTNDGSTVSETIDFTFDQKNGVLTAITPYICEAGSATALSLYGYWLSPVFSKEAPEAPEVVTPPADLVVEEYSIVSKDYEDNPQTGSVFVGFDGNDVYIQGLSQYAPDAWIKGTISGNVVTFEPNQYLGTYGGSSNTIYFLPTQYGGSAVTFNYDEETETFTATADFFGIITYNGEGYIDFYHADAVITKVLEKAATPATPSITDISNTNYGYVVYFNVPSLDTEGNGLLASKLYYEFFTDVEGTINPLTFTPTTHVKLEEDLTLIPYGFTENYDFYNGQIYLNNLYSEDWNRIGIKSIYYGGGEENESEISWYTIKPYAVTLTAKSVDSKNYYATYFEGENSRLADENTTVYTAALSENQKWLTLTEVEDKVIPAGNAVVLLSSNETITLTYTDAEATTLANNVLQGSDESQTVDPSTYYVLSAKNGVVGFYLFAGTELGANKAYIPASVVSSEARVLTFGDVTDAIQQMEKEQVTEDAAVYDLSGRRIANRQLNKGVYINNGKKIVIK